MALGSLYVLMKKTAGCAEQGECQEAQMKTTNDVDQAVQRLVHAADRRVTGTTAASEELPSSPPGASKSPGPTVLTVEETAEVLKVGRTTIYDLMRTGQLSSSTIGRLRRIPYTDVGAYL